MSCSAYFVLKALDAAVMLGVFVIGMDYLETGWSLVASRMAELCLEIHESMTCFFNFLVYQDRYQQKEFGNAACGTGCEKSRVARDCGAYYFASALPLSSAARAAISSRITA